MLDQYNLYRPWIISAAYIYGLIGLFGWSVNILRQPTSLTSQLLGLIGLGASIWLLRHLLCKAGLLEVKLQSTGDPQSESHADLLKAKQALLKRIEVHYSLTKPSCKPSSSEELLVTKDESGTYHCQLNHHEYDKGIIFNYDYSIDSNRKLPVYVKKSETLSSLANIGGSVHYEYSQPEPASQTELFDLYQRLDCRVK